MNIITGSSTFFCLAAALASWAGTAALAQNADYFGGLNRDGSGEITLEVENTAEDTKPRDMIRFDPLVVTIVGAKIAQARPNTGNADLVQAPTVQDHGQVMQGAQLKVSLSINGPAEKNWKRIAVLFSTLSSPENRLSQDVVRELGGKDALALHWKRTNLDKLVSYAPIPRSVHFTRTDTGDGTSRFKGGFRLHTANLRPGSYLIYLRVYRNVGGEMVERDVRKFAFSIVDAPLSLVADLPSLVPGFDEDKSALNIRYPVMLSDWAVPPLHAVMKSTVRGFSLDQGRMTSELDGNMFDILLMPSQASVGRRAKITLQLRDGLGRTAVLSHHMTVVDGRNNQLRVDMPSRIDAGDTLHGTVSYPQGYTLSEPPFIADRRGFEWTNSDFTTFRINVGEKGGNHRRAFSIAVRGRLPGLDHDPVLEWEGEYRVTGPNPTYDPAARQRAREKRKANAERRRRALVKLLIGKDRSQAETETDKGSDMGANGGSYEIVSTEIFDNRNTGNEGANPARNDLSGTAPQSSGARSGGLQYIGADGPPLNSRTEERMTSICGVAIDGYADRFTGALPTSGWWLTDYDQNSGRGEFANYQGWITLMKLGMPDLSNGRNGMQENEMKFFARDCVLSSQSTARTDGTRSEYEYYTNGGRKSASDGNRVIEWDRAGNITYDSAQ